MYHVLKKYKRLSLMFSYFPCASRPSWFKVQKVEDSSCTILVWLTLLMNCLSSYVISYDMVKSTPYTYVLTDFMVLQKDKRKVWRAPRRGHGGGQCPRWPLHQNDGEKLVKYCSTIWTPPGESLSKSISTVDYETTKLTCAVVFQILFMIGMIARSNNFRI